MKFITEDDDFGIRRTLREIYKQNVITWGDTMETQDGEEYEEFKFNVWMNQFIPPAYYESKGTILRHIDEIKNISYKTYWVWIKRGNQLTCVPKFTDELKRQLDTKMISLPTYQEIEEEKQKWQSHSEYNKEEGFSEPLEEEVVQLVIKKGGEINEKKK